MRAEFQLRVTRDGGERNSCGLKKSGKEVGTESSTDIHTPPRVKQTANGKCFYSTGGSAWYSVMTWRGGTGVVGGRPRGRRYM